MTTMPEQSGTLRRPPRMMKLIWRRMEFSDGANPCAAAQQSFLRPLVVRDMRCNLRKRSQIVATFVVAVAQLSAVETVTMICVSHVRGTWQDVCLYDSKKEIVCWSRGPVTIGKMVWTGASASTLVLIASFRSLPVLSGSAFSGLAGQ